MEKLPAPLRIEIERTYNGKIIDTDFLNKNPLFVNIMPTKPEFDSTYRTVLKQAEETGKNYKINLSENGIKVYELYSA